MLNFKIIIKRTLLILCTISFCLNWLVAQQFSQVLKEPVDALKQKDYLTALSQYEKLLRIYPKDASYHYYTGLCMTLLNTRLTEASDHLKFAASTSVTADAYYYLGYISLYSYHFDEAENYFTKFIESSPKSAIEKQTGEQALLSAQNAKSLTQKALVIKTLSKNEMQINNFTEHLESITYKGRFINMPEEMKIIAGLTTENPVIFMPSEMKPGDYIYFSAFAGKRKGKDIFRMRKTGDKQWNKPENIGYTINTFFDDDYPWFDSQNSVLYFSSKGHDGMGGYDVFKSAYNWDKNTWSEPVNIGFPINSPFDDLCYIKADSGNSAIFITSRFNENGKVTLCKISTPEMNTTKELSDITQAKNAAALELQSDMITKENKTELILYKPTNSKPISNNTSNTIKTKTLKKQGKPSSTLSAEEREKYDFLLKEALLLQVKSDSVVRLADEKREIAQNTTKEEEISRLNKEIYQLKVKAATLQKEADQKYVMAREIETKLTTDNITVADINQEQSDNEKSDGNADVSGLKIKTVLYQPQSSIDTNTGIKKKNTNQQDIAKNDAPNNQLKIKSQTNENHDETHGIVSKTIKFEILGKSPYSEMNPIPVTENPVKGLVYMIQLGAFSKTVAPDRFGGLKPVTGEKITTTKGIVTKYYVGVFTKSNDSENALKQVRNYGFKEAYIVAFYNGKNIPIEKAKKLE